VRGVREIACDASWFPFDVDVKGRVVHFVRLSEDTVARASFLDSRLDPAPASVRSVPFEAISALPSVERPIAWLWHTSFCGSTLVARILHVSPHNVSLREPLILRRLSDALERGEVIAEAVAILLPLLARPWHRGGTVLVKPTHAALNIAAQLMGASSSSRAILLTSSLEDFMVSHLKKTPETLAKVPQLAERALSAGGLLGRLPPAAFDPPGTLAMIGLQWAAQRELLAGLMQQMGPGRAKVVDWTHFQQGLKAGAYECADWLGLDIPRDKLGASVELHAGHHAKATDRPFNVSTRQDESDALRKQFGRELATATEWVDQHVRPFMSPLTVDPVMPLRPRE
jgi:hypothetical protein